MSIRQTLANLATLGKSTAPEPSSTQSGAPAQLFHGSLTSGLTTLKAGAHLGTRQAALDRMERVAEQSDMHRFPGAAKEGQELPTLYPVQFAPKRVLDVPDTAWGVPAIAARDFHGAGVITADERAAINNGSRNYLDVLGGKGYDALRYQNEHEDPGSYSYVSLRDIPLSSTAPPIHQTLANLATPPPRNWTPPRR